MNKPKCKFSIKEKYEEITNLMLYGIGWPSEQSPVKRKEFDIHSARLSDSRIECLGHCTESTLFTYFSDPTMELCETRDDIIAKAKHFKLTAEDLK